MQTIFIKLEKPYFGPTLGSLGPRTSEQGFFKKNRAPSLFELDDTQTSYKIPENFYKLFRRKTPDKQTNV